MSCSITRSVSRFKIISLVSTFSKNGLRSQIFTDSRNQDEKKCEYAILQTYRFKIIQFNRMLIFDRFQTLALCSFLSNEYGIFVFFINFVGKCFFFAHDSPYLLVQFFHEMPIICGIIYSVFMLNDGMRNLAMLNAKIESEGEIEREVDSKNAGKHQKVTGYQHRSEN